MNLEHELKSLVRHVVKHLDGHGSATLTETDAELSTTHLIVGEASIVNDVVNCAISAAQRYVSARIGQDQHRPNSTHSTVALMSFLGKSLAVTSPPTAIASPPACFISSTTAWAFSDHARKKAGPESNQRRASNLWSKS